MATPVTTLIQQLWREHRLPLIDGVLFATGQVVAVEYRAITLREIRGAAPVVADGVPQPLDTAADWVEVDERASELDVKAGLRYSCGEGSFGDDGYVACSRIGTDELVWAAFFLSSNPFEALRVADPYVEAVNNHGHWWRFSAGDPRQIEVI